MPLDWKSDLGSYDRIVALKFKTRREFALAIHLAFSKELRRMPLDLLGGHTIAIPQEAVPFFSGLEFEEQEIVDGGDLSAEELAALRRERDEL